MGNSVRDILKEGRRQKRAKCRQCKRITTWEFKFQTVPLCSKCRREPLYVKKHGFKLFLDSSSVETKPYRP